MSTRRSTSVRCRLCRRMRWRWQSRRVYRGWECRDTVECAKAKAEKYAVGGIEETRDEMEEEFNHG